MHIHEGMHVNLFTVMVSSSQKRPENTEVLF